MYEEKILMKNVTKLNEYNAFITSFLDDSEFSDPHLMARIEADEKLEDMLTKKDHHCFVTENSDGINGLFILLIIPEEKYLEMLIGITREENAVEDGVVTGYIDVTHCFAENEPFDLLVKEEYRRKGYGRQLLAKALLENEPKDMMLLVDFDNEQAINLYESMGFIKKEKGNLLTAYWKVPDR